MVGQSLCVFFAEVVQLADSEAFAFAMMVDLQLQLPRQVLIAKAAFVAVVASVNFSQSR